MSTVAPPPRLGLIQARAAPVAVLFRRGSSRRVELVRWDTRADTFQRRHWFHGRICHRRSDLSPDGTLLVYFAARHTVVAERLADGGEPPALADRAGAVAQGRCVVGRGIVRRPAHPPSRPSPARGRAAPAPIPIPRAMIVPT